MVAEVRDRLSVSKFLNFLHPNALDAPHLRRGGCDTDHCLVVVEVRDRLLVSQFFKIFNQF